MFFPAVQCHFVCSFRVLHTLVKPQCLLQHATIISFALSVSQQRNLLVHGMSKVGKTISRRMEMPNVFVCFSSRRRLLFGIDLILKKYSHDNNISAFRSYTSRTERASSERSCREHLKMTISAFCRHQRSSMRLRRFRCICVLQA